MDNELKKQLENKLSNVISNLNQKLLDLRVGKLNLNVFDKIQADYYGDKIQINQIASITSPEYNQVIIKPYNNGDLKLIVNSINSSNLKLVPNVEGDKIRIIIPSMTEEIRKNTVKKLKLLVEESKVHIRNIRHEFFNLLKNKDDYSDDLKKNIQNDIQKIIDNYNDKINNIFNIKEKEIMTF